MEFIETKLEGAYIINPKVFKDERGFFLESYSEKVFAEKGIDTKFVQDNHSFSVKAGTLRGLHFQSPPSSQVKLVRVIRGKIYDVIVDIRKNSPTYGKWEGFELSAENFKMLYIPTGFAHGFCTLESNVEFLYKCSDFYAPKDEGGLLWNDSDLAIEWPVKDPTILERDRNWQKFSAFESPF